MNTGEKTVNGKTIYQGVRGGRYVMINGRRIYKFIPEKLINRLKSTSTNNNKNNNNANSIYYIGNRRRVYSKLGYLEYSQNRQKNRIKRNLKNHRIVISTPKKYPNKMNNKPAKLVKLTMYYNRNLQKSNNNVNRIYKNLFNTQSVNNINNTGQNFILSANNGRLITNKYGLKLNNENLRNKLRNSNFKIVPAHPDRYKLFNNRPNKLNTIILKRRNFMANKNVINNAVSKIIKRKKTNVTFNYNNNNSKCGFILKTQTSGTCWAHALINSWLMSNKGRKILQEKLNKFQENHGMLEYKNGVCPMKGKISQAYFWSYIDHVLMLMENSNLPRFNEKFNEVNVITNSLRLYNPSNSRSNYNRVQGGTKHDFDNMNRILFNKSEIVDEDFKYKNSLSVKNNTKLITLRITNTAYKLPEKIRINNKTFTLVNGYLGVAISGETRNAGHAIAAAMCNNTPIVIDSNSGVPQKLNWTDGLKIQKELEKVVEFYKLKLTNSQVKEMNKMRPILEMTEQGRKVIENFNKKLNKKMTFKFLIVNYVRDC